MGSPPPKKKGTRTFFLRFDRYLAYQNDKFKIRKREAQGGFFFWGGAH